MKKRHIFECIKNYSLSKSVRLHMPGHKGRDNLFFGNAKTNCSELTSPFGCDITELSFSDNLDDPKGIILEAEKDIAKILGAKRSFILTGGSSLGVLSMVYAVRNRGKKIIIARSSHKSVYNALKLCGLQPVFLYEDISSGLPVPHYINKEIIESVDNDVIGALITTPDYFGNSADLEYFSRELKRQNKLLLVDGAHGAHCAFTNRKIYPGRYADIWVDGAHKTLESLTQGAILNVNSEELIEGVREGLSIFSTSSPSYLIMASVENGVKSFSEIKEETFESFSKNRDIIVSAVKEKGFSVFESEDKLKLTIDFNNRANGLDVQNHFEKLGIFVELASPRFMLMMFSPFLTREEAERVKRGILSAPEKREKHKNYFNYHIPPFEMSYNKALEKPYEYVNLKDAKGRTSAGNAGVFPPCYPVIVAGETFDNDVIATLSVENTFGIYDGKVKVIRRENID